MDSSSNAYYLVGKYHLERTIYIVRAGSEAEAIEKISADVSNGEEVRIEFADFSDILNNPQEVHVIDGDFEDYEEALYFAEQG